MSSLRITVFDHQEQRVIDEVLLDQYPLRIGRAPDNHLILPYPFVSSHHAEVRREGLDLRLHQLDVRNPLSLGTQALPASGVLIAARLVVSLGPLELRFELAGPARGPLSTHSAAAGALDDLALNITGSRPDTTTGSHPDITTGSRPDVTTGSRPDITTGSRPDRTDASTDLPEIAAWLPLLPPDQRNALHLSARAADLLRLFAACTLELTRLCADQRAQLGLDPNSSPTFDSPDELLRVLLAPGGPERDAPVLSLFTALCDHQRALAPAACLAAREALSSLAPPVLERSLAFPWPTRSAALWRHYQASHAALLGDAKDHFTPVFRAIFARTYAASLPPASPAPPSSHVP